MIRRTNYGLWTNEEKKNETEKAVDYIIECAKSVGIEIIPCETALSVRFAAEVLRRVKAQEPKTGRWIRITTGAIPEIYICSECGRHIENEGVEGLLPIKYPYCHCGAKMEA